MNALAERLMPLQKITLQQPSHMRFRHWAKLYHSRFPYQELAPVSSIAQSIRQQQSHLEGLITSKGQWAAFTLCEFYTGSTLLAYLATAKDFEGQGLASQVIENALLQHLSDVKPFFWLEASPKLWAFYKKQGFKRLHMGYRIPEFYTSGSEKMGLFIKTHSAMDDIPVEVVKSFVSELLLSGYELKPTDPRYKQQMAVIQNYPQSTIPLI